jgi:hypothetical protein
LANAADGGLIERRLKVNEPLARGCQPRGALTPLLCAPKRILGLEALDLITHLGEACVVVVRERGELVNALPRFCGMQCLQKFVRAGIRRNGLEPVSLTFDLFDLRFEGLLHDVADMYELRKQVGAVWQIRYVILLCDVDGGGARVEHTHLGELGWAALGRGGPGHRPVLKFGAFTLLHGAGLQLVVDDGTRRLRIFAKQVRVDGVSRPPCSAYLLEHPHVARLARAVVPVHHRYTRGGDGERLVVAERVYVASAVYALQAHGGGRPGVHLGEIEA